MCVCVCVRAWRYVCVCVCVCARGWGYVRVIIIVPTTHTQYFLHKLYTVVTANVRDMVTVASTLAPVS